MKRCWALCLIILFTTFAIADTVPATAPKSVSDSSDDLGTRPALTMHVNAGVDLHRWVDTGSDARIVPGFGVTADYYFSDVFGVYVSADYSNRGFKLLGLSSSTTFLDLGLGVALRYRGNLFSSTSINYLEVGAMFAVPFGDFTGTAAITPATSKMFIGAMLQGSSAYSIGNGLALGPVTWIKFGLGNPVSGLAVSRWFTHVGIGAQLTF